MSTVVMTRRSGRGRRVLTRPLTRALTMVLTLLARLTLTLDPPPAQASEPALAETLYQDGRTLMAAGRTAEACAKFEESLRLDQATGTLLNLAVCHETLGKFATAWAEFRAAGANAAHDRREDRTRLAREHLARIEPHLSHLTILVPETARVTGLRITLDGTVLGESAWNVATPIDPGTHVVEATAPGHRALANTVAVGTTASAPVVEVALLAAPLPPPPVAVGRPPEQPGAALSPEGTPRAAGMPAYVITGAGVAALAVGAVFGVRALSKWSDRNRDCPMEACNDAGLAASRQAERAALTADIAVGAGIVAVAVGGYLFFRAHARSVDASARTAALNGKGRHSWKLTLAPSTPLGMGIGLQW